MKSDKKIIGYTCGSFDMFHVGHLNILRNAKSMCDHLIVAVTIDGIVSHKKEKCVIPYEHHIEIVRSIRCVDTAIPQNEIDKVRAYEKIKYDILFVGDDWYESPTWMKYEKILKNYGVKIIYFPYSKQMSTTEIRNKFKKEDEL